MINKLIFRVGGLLVSLMETIKCYEHLLCCCKMRRFFHMKSYSSAISRYLQELNV